MPTNIDNRNKLGRFVWEDADIEPVARPVEKIVPKKDATLEKRIKALKEAPQI